MIGLSCDVCYYLKKVQPSSGDLQMELSSHNKGEGVVWSPEFSVGLEFGVDLESDEGHTGPRVVESHTEVKQVIVHIVLPQVDSEPARAQQHQMQAGSLHFGKVQKT